MQQYLTKKFGTRVDRDYLSIDDITNTMATIIAKNHIVFGGRKLNTVITMTTVLGCKYPTNEIISKYVDDTIQLKDAIVYILRDFIVPNCSFVQ